MFLQLIDFFSKAVLRHSDISTTADIYVHTDEQIVTEGSAVLTETILGDFLLNCDPVVTQESEMIS